MPEIATITESITVADSITMGLVLPNISVSESITLHDAFTPELTSIVTNDGIYNLIKFDADYDFGFTLFVRSVIFVPGAAEDNVVLYHDEVGGVLIVDLYCPSQLRKQEIVNKRVRLVLDASASVCSTGARLIVIT